MKGYTSIWKTELTNILANVKSILKIVHPLNNKKAVGILVTIKHNYEDNALLLSNRFKQEFEEFYDILIKKFMG